MAEADPITLARLDGTAYRLLREHADPATCTRELRALTPDAGTLGTAAGTALGGHRATGRHDADRVARLLLAAGGDPEVCERVAGANAERLAREHSRPGIGMP